jgi:hypothetical protein
MGMNLDELEEDQASRIQRRSGNFRALWDAASQSAKPLDITRQVFGAKDYVPNPLSERIALPPAPQSDLVDPRMTVIGPVKKTDGVRLPVGCNAVSGYHEMCERGTVGCTNHRRSASRFFRCYINHADLLCKCSQPVIVDWQMLENAENAAMYVLGIIKGNAKSAKLSPDDVQYLAVSVTKIMAHWARKALGHKPEDEVNAAPVVPIPHSD